MAKKYKVRATNGSSTFDAGIFAAETGKQAVEMAKKQYRDSLPPARLGGRPVRAFRFFIVEEFPCCEDGAN